MSCLRLLTVFGLLFSLTSLSQRGKHARFQNIETSHFGEKGLSRQIWDQKGNFWARNEKGIVKHNGYSKKVFSIEDKDMFPGEQLAGLQKTDEDEFWITYRDTNVLTLLNPEDESFEHFLVPELLNDSLPMGLIVRVKKEENGQLWLCTWGNGLIKFNKGHAPNEVFIFDHNTNEQVKNPLKNKTNGGGGNSKGNRTGTGNGGGAGSRKEKNKDAGRYIKDIVIQKDGNFFITFFNGRVGKNSYPGIFNPTTKEYNTIDLDPMLEDYSSLLSSQIRIAISIVHWVHQDEYGKYWIGSYSGPLYLDLENGIVKRISEKGEDETIQNQVNALFYIRSGAELWISTFNRGVMVIDVKSHNVNFHYSDPLNTNSIASNKTEGISVDPLGNIWVVNGESTFSVYTPYIHSFKVMFWRDMDLEYSNRSAQTIPVNQLYVESSKQIYVSSRVGLLQYDFESMNISRKYQFKHMAEITVRRRGVEHFKVLGDSAFLSFDTHPHMLDLESGEMEEIGKTYGMGKIGFRHEPKMTRRLYFHSGRDGSHIGEYLPKTTKMKSLIKMHDAHLSETFSFITNQGKWMFSEGINGVGRFVLCDEEDSTYNIFSPSKPESYFPDSTVVCALIQDGTDEILVGTEKGLYNFNEVTYESEKISERVGLKEDEGVNSMVKSDDGNIWLALNSELICWNPQTDEFKRYGKSLGLDISAFLPAIAQKDELGNLYFATMVGILLFHPNDVLPPKDELILSVSDIRVNEKSLNKDFGSFLNGDFNLSYNDNYLEFDFYTNQVFELAPHSYSYQLVGQSNRWISCGTNHNLRFDNLQHGEYVLHFKAQNAYGIESEIYDIPFKIKKPFWLTWWFFVLIGLTIFALVYILVKGRMKALRKRSELLEETVSERTAEVVEQKKEAEKQREEAEHQKEIVEEKQKEITDSITYAKRIQDAILPGDDFISTNLPNSFVMYRPKDIVAGDFYWMEALSKDEVIFAAADCTGHGVPGAMVSVVCNNALNRTVREFGLKDPGKLLDKTRELVIEQFEQSASESIDVHGATIKDGMDIALCHMNKKSKVLQYSGANNPLWLVRDGELIETKGDKQPIGKFEPNKPFTTHTVQLQKGDRFYIFSDGYADQFGGEKGKKFKSSSLKKLLILIHQKPMNEQLTELQKNFDDWKGTFEQLDDVCVIGFEI